MYYLVLIVLFICSIREIISAKTYRGLFLLVYIIMTLMAIFRFGQLGDYFTYYYLYQNPIASRDIVFILYAYLFKFLGASYQFFLTVTELIIFVLAFPFFYRTCKCSLISLFLFYTYTFMVCPMSALRQAICLSLLLYSYYLLVEKKKVKFFVIVGIGSLIHLSFFTVFLIGWLYDKKFYNKPVFLFFVFFATFIMLAGIDLTANIRGLFEGRSVAGATSSSFDNMFQLGLRLILVFPLLLFKPPYGTDGYYAKAICIIGYILYCVLSSNILVAGRIEYFFRTFLCLFVADLSLRLKPLLSDVSNNADENLSSSSSSISSFNRFRKMYLSMRGIVLSLFVFVHLVLFFKNIDGAISQGQYKEGVTVFNFPYISIFDKAEIDTYTNMNKFNYNLNE